MSNQGRHTNPFSKLKLWCIRKNVPALALALIVLVLVGVGLTCLVAALASWDLISILTSPTATLAYVLFGVGVVWALYYNWSSRN